MSIGLTNSRKYSHVALLPLMGLHSIPGGKPLVFKEALSVLLSKSLSLLEMEDWEKTFEAEDGLLDTRVRLVISSVNLQQTMITKYEE